MAKVSEMKLSGVNPAHVAVMPKMPGKKSGLIAVEDDKSAPSVTGAQPSQTVAHEHEAVIEINLVDDSPFQPRTTIVEEALDELSSSLGAAGLNEPIKVRPIGTRYQLISGHRRIRAARRIGWITIPARIITCTDREAESSVLLQNESRVDLSDYDHGKLYRRGLERGFAETEEGIAKYFGTSQPKVSGCLKILELPTPFLEFLEKHPESFGRRCAKEIRDLLKAHPTQQEVILNGVQRFVTDGADQSTLKGWVEQALSKKRRDGAPPREKAVVTDAGGKAIYTAKVVKRQVQIDIKDSTVDPETVSKWIVAALRDRVDLKK